MAVILVIVATFALCYGIDYLFTKKFRSKKQHQSGLSVRLSKHYAIFGVLLLVLGIAALISGVLVTPVLLFGGILVIVMGVGLLTYYMTFSIFYDADSFILTTFGQKAAEYRFGEIRGQMLYIVQGGNVLVELHMNNGCAVQVQSAMDGAVRFLDHAHTAWLSQTGRDPRSYDFYDPENHQWFPPVVEE